MGGSGASSSPFVALMEGTEDGVTITWDIKWLISFTGNANVNKLEGLKLHSEYIYALLSSDT